MTLPGERQQAIRQTLGGIADPQERLTVALNWKADLEPLADDERTDINLVRGCVSRVWLAGRIEEGRCRFRVDADSPLVRGLVRMLCAIYDGATPYEVMAVEPVVLEEMGILQNLSPTRRNGIAAVRLALASFAMKTRLSQMDG
ncbi:MAG: SufE family protein [Chthoniobacteraceae bacterium]|jgi:cysteine desulfuration protein SufE